MRHSAVALRARFLALATLIPCAGLAQSPAAPKELPLKYAGGPTTPAITAADLMTRLYIYADDSMMGRSAGTEYNVKATAYLEREVRRLGLKPAGDSGGYFQYLPVVARAIDTTSTITVEGVTFRAGVDFLAGSSARRVTQLTGMPVVFGGMLYDTLNIPAPETFKGKVVLFRPFVPPPGFTGQGFVSSNGFQAFRRALSAVAVHVEVRWDRIPPSVLRGARNPSDVTFLRQDEGLPSLNVTTRVAEAMLGGPLLSATKGAAGRAVSSDIRFTETPRPTRNVVAILPGTDPKLRGQYVAIGAHNDHVNCAIAGGCRPPVEHDSLLAFMRLVRPQGADNPRAQPTPVQDELVRSTTDSLRKLHPARLDTIYNGADDDGSGSVSVLEIAEAFAKGRPTPLPKRSILFIWHVGEEMGLWGSAWFTDHPTVPRDSIVAALNLDMIGRGAATDVTGQDKDGGLLHGGPGYVQLVGSRRLSTELGDVVEQVNTGARLGMRFDYAMDANGHPQNIYCRSDHWSYARYGIPVVFFTTGGHAEYHQVTDEPQYIEYDHMAQVAQLVYESALKVAALDHRVKVDKPKPDPKGPCVQ